MIISKKYVLTVFICFFSVHACVASDLKNIISQSVKRLFWQKEPAKKPQSTIETATISITPVPINIVLPQIVDKAEAKKFTKAQLQRDLCRILNVMRQEKLKEFSFASNYMHKPAQKDPYVLFAYAVTLLKNKIYEVEAEFSDEAILELNCDVSSSVWTCKLTF